MIPIRMHTQPDDQSCGPTCLHSIYNFYNDSINLEKLVKEYSYQKSGGTIGVHIALHALERGYEAHIYHYNLKLFDPSWKYLNSNQIIEKLKLQAEIKKKERIKEISQSYVKYLERGGKLFFEDLSPNLLNRYFQQNIPIITGLSATYLYDCKREYSNENHESQYDDIIGSPMGHFVVLCGYDKENQIVVADPYKENPYSGNNYYSVRMGRLINSILLGIMTYDANLIIIEPKVSQ